MSIESKRGCNSNDLKGAQITQMLQIRSHLICCIMVSYIVSYCGQFHKMLYCSLFSLCCYCFLRICILNKGCYCKDGNLPGFQLFNPKLFEILYVGRDKAFCFRSCLSGKHSSIIALSGSYTDKLCFRMKPEGEIKSNVPEYSTGNIKRHFFLALVGYRSYVDKPEYRPASCKCSCCFFYYW